VSKLNWNRLGAFVAGTFFGGYVLGFLAKLMGKV
jgi:hypothetical protein